MYTLSVLTSEDLMFALKVGCWLSSRSMQERGMADNANATHACVMCTVSRADIFDRDVLKHCINRSVRTDRAFDRGLIPVL